MNFCSAKTALQFSVVSTLPLTWAIASTPLPIMTVLTSSLVHTSRVHKAPLEHRVGWRDRTRFAVRHRQLWRDLGSSDGPARWHSARKRRIESIGLVAALSARSIIHALRTARHPAFPLEASFSRHGRSLIGDGPLVQWGSPRLKCFHCWPCRSHLFLPSTAN